MGPLGKHLVIAPLFNRKGNEFHLLPFLLITGEIMPALLEVKSKPLTFSHAGKQKAYEWLVENPTLDFGAYRIMSSDPSLDEKSFDEVARAFRVANADFDEADVSTPKISPDTFSARKALTKKSSKKIKGESAMAKEATGTEAPRKRGRPPGSKKAVATAEKVKAKGKRGRPPSSSKEGGKNASFKSPKSKVKKGETGTRYSAEKRQEIVEFITSKGRGGLAEAQRKFRISYPTLARWVKQAGLGKGASKVEKASKPGRPRKTEAVPPGHIMISKSVLKEFRKGLASLELAFGKFANALKVLE